MAEASITINDVVFVVDCGKAKETTYDALNNTPCLLPSWISKASARQVRCILFSVCFFYAKMAVSNNLCCIFLGLSMWVLFHFCCVMRILSLLDWTSADLPSHLPKTILWPLPSRPLIQDLSFLLWVPQCHFTTKALLRFVLEIWALNLTCIGLCPIFNKGGKMHFHLGLWIMYTAYMQLYHYICIHIPNFLGSRSISFQVSRKIAAEATTKATIKPLSQLFVTRLYPSQKTSFFLPSLLFLEIRICVCGLCYRC